MFKKLLILALLLVAGDSYAMKRPADDASVESQEAKKQKTTQTVQLFGSDSGEHGIEIPLAIAQQSQTLAEMIETGETNLHFIEFTHETLQQVVKILTTLTTRFSKEEARLLALIAIIKEISEAKLVNAVKNALIFLDIQLPWEEINVRLAHEATTGFPAIFRALQTEQSDTLEDVINFPIVRTIIKI